MRIGRGLSSPGGRDIFEFRSRNWLLYDKVDLLNYSVFDRRK